MNTDPGVHPDVAAAVRAAGAALGDAGYAVEEVEPPPVEAAARVWATLVVNEMRHLTMPPIREHG
jgi:amidase